MLDDDALDELDQLLLDLPDVDEAVLLSELDGYLAGLLVSPWPVDDEAWLSPIWGGADAPFPGDPARGDRLVALVRAHKADIAGALLEGDLAYRPIYDIDDSNGEAMWEIWATGFGRAMALDGRDWDPLLETGDEDLGAAFLGLVMYVVTANGVPSGGPDEDEIYDLAPETIPYLVETLYRRQRGLPRVVLAPPAVAPATPRVKVGRNAPCPCGSGRKFKKCCGAAGG